MYTHEYTTYEYTVNVSRDRADADYPAALNLSSREEWTIITAAWQPSHRAVGNPPISSAALFARHSRTRRRSKARRSSDVSVMPPGRDAARERDAQSRTRCQSGARQSIESEAPENTMSFESEPPRSATLGNVIPEAQRPRARHSRARYPVQNATLRSAQQRGHTARKRYNGASLQRNRSVLSENAARGPLFRLPTTSNPELRPQNRRSQMLPTPNSSIPPAQHARNEAPLRRFLTETTQEDATRP